MILILQKLERFLHHPIAAILSAAMISGTLTQLLMGGHSIWLYLLLMNGSWNIGWYLCAVYHGIEKKRK